MQEAIFYLGKQQSKVRLKPHLQLQVYLSKIPNSSIFHQCLRSFNKQMKHFCEKDYLHSDEMSFHTVTA